MHVIAEMIDRVCIERRHARILSVASGHVRELLFSHAVRAAWWRGRRLDQDARSLAEAEATTARRR